MVDYWRHGQTIAMGMEIGDGDWGRGWRLGSPVFIIHFAVSKIVV